MCWYRFCEVLIRLSCGVGVVLVWPYVVLVLFWNDPYMVLCWHGCGVVLVLLCTWCGVRATAILGCPLLWCWCCVALVLVWCWCCCVLGVLLCCVGKALGWCDTAVVCGALVWCWSWYGHVEVLIWPLCGVGVVLVLARLWCDTAVVGGACSGQQWWAAALVWASSRRADPAAGERATERHQQRCHLLLFWCTQHSGALGVSGASNQICTNDLILKLDPVAGKSNRETGRGVISPPRHGILVHLAFWCTWSPDAVVHLTKVE